MKPIAKSMIKVIALTATLSSSILSAHERFMVTSHSILSDDKAQYVTLTSSISNAIFHPDRPFGNNDKGIDSGELATLFNLLEATVINPEGKTTNDISWQAFQRMSVADLKLDKSGTYRVSLVQPDVAMTTFKKADGTPWRLFGPNPKLPDGATNIVRRTTQSRVETFVTFNEPNNAAVQPTGVGVELGGETHPNDLFAGETANFQLIFNGKPLTQKAKVKVIRAGTRHRNDRNERYLDVDEKGRFSFTPTKAGYYFLGAETKINVPQPANVDVKHFSLYLSLEVFPE